ncbi:MAG: ATP-binding protein [cyanobacterium endosymbiont of Rhopalodia sterrenbergii]
MTKFKRPKASIKVRLQSIKRDRLVHLQVTVKDNGEGIIETTKINLFDRFYRLNWSRVRQSLEESSLRLAIAEAIVKNHQRQITINSSLNHRKILTVTPPLNYSKSGSDLVQSGRLFKSL